MERQHTENLFRRQKGKLVKIKGLSGGEYKGYVVEVTNDYVSLHDRDSAGDDKTHTVVLFNAIESVFLGETA
jgi:hypothetical protein